MIEFLYDMNFEMSSDVVLINRKNVISNQLLFSKILEKEKIYNDTLKIID